ncbi:proteasome-type protease [Thermoproteus tenax]|uniref:Proteasome-type protease n=1 Tax=Thermoproteus tenax (strain ATCC 35583 / DSM 2078 / JCM 9277 / NBRC 100435 / Kra 1) TaxID=768679 RepID=G4RMX7_THETK|nr:proteasome-type protease [Thermoproteus tenax]CCC80921.1 proteasome-type protease [Thermoproteus tenax Kra 1]
MTLVIGVVWRAVQGVLVVADTRSSMGPVFLEERKIHPVKRGGLGYAVLAGSGNPKLVKKGYRVIEETIDSWIAQNGTRTPKSQELNKMVDTAERLLIEELKFLRDRGIDPCEDGLSILWASVSDEGDPRLYHIDCTGLADAKHDNPGYVLLGRGLYTGALALLRLFNFSPEHTWDMGLYTAFIIDLVSEVDSSVSPFLGDSYLIRKEGEKVVLGPLKPEAYQEYKKKIAKRREAIQLLWQALESVDNEDEVMEILREKIRQIQK